MKTYRIAAIEGDGIGKEVLPVGVKVLSRVASRLGINIEIKNFEWACAEFYQQHGKMLPDDWKDVLKTFDAIYFGAVGWPDIVPDHVSLWGSLLQFRREFDQYINLRPVRLMPGISAPLRDKQPGDIDFIVVRENTEGEYSDIGGHAFPGTPREVVLQQSVFTRIGVDRVLNYAFKLASKRPAKHVSAATKSNGIAISMPFWDERLEAVAQDFPDVRWDKHHIDIMAARFVLNPEQFDVVVASNLFGDILSDLGPACTGTVGIAPSANINPERLFPSLFEPVHGSAPDIYGQGLANPIAAIWSAALMFQFFAEQDERCLEAEQIIMTAIEKVLATGPRTPDLGGTAKMHDMEKAILEHIA